MIKRSELKIGQKVSVSTRDRRNRQEVVGEIAEILTNAESHPHGILVSLSDGNQGRVQKILSTEPNMEVSFPKSPPQEAPSAQSHRPLQEILDQGEDQFVEYKTSLLWTHNRSQEWLDAQNSSDVNRYGVQTSSIIIAKVIASFLNTTGGCLLIGLKENKSGGGDEVVGIDGELQKLDDPTLDGYRRFIVDKVLRPFLPSDIFNHLINYISISFEQIKERQVCRIDIADSDTRVFLKIKGRQYFFIRVDATTREIHGEQIVAYCEKRFSKQ